MKNSSSIKKKILLLHLHVHISSFIEMLAMKICHFIEPGGRHAINMDDEDIDGEDDDNDDDDEDFENNPELLVRMGIQQHVW